jgi:hypothetical protein
MIAFLEEKDTNMPKKPFRTITLTILAIATVAADSMSKVLKLKATGTERSQSVYTNQGPMKHRF